MRPRGSFFLGWVPLRPSASDQMHVTLFEKILAVTLIAAGVWAGWFFLEDLQKGLANVRRDLNPDDHEAWTRGLEIVCLHKGIFGSERLSCRVGYLIQGPLNRARFTRTSKIPPSEMPQRRFPPPWTVEETGRRPSR